MSTMIPHMTRTQRKIMDLLADGLPHATKDIQACLPDELSTISQHLYHLRKMLRPQGQDILCQRQYDATYYIFVRLINNSE